MNRKQSQGLAFALALYTLRGVSTEKCLELMRTTFWYFRSEKRNDKAFISQSVFFCICTSSPTCRDEELNVKGFLTKIVHMWLLLYLNFNLQTPSTSGVRDPNRTVTHEGVCKSGAHNLKYSGGQ